MLQMLGGIAAGVIVTCGVLWVVIVKGLNES
jgi:hypothetical protein